VPPHTHNHWCRNTTLTTIRRANHPFRFQLTSLCIWFPLRETLCVCSEGLCSCPRNHLPRLPRGAGLPLTATEVRGTAKRKFDESFSSRPFLPHLPIRDKSVNAIDSCPNLWASMRRELLGFRTTATARRTPDREGAMFHGSI
jgi:hypothetical protein